MSHHNEEPNSPCEASIHSDDGKVGSYSVQSGRRAVLMALAATGATMLVPSSWSTPALQWGVLPAHAQTSGGNTGGDNNGGNSGANTGDTNGGSNGANNGGNTGTNNGGNNAGDMDSGLLDSGPAEAGPPSACPPADPTPTAIVEERYLEDGGVPQGQAYWEINFGPEAGAPCSVTPVKMDTYQAYFTAFISTLQGGGKVWTANQNYQGTRFIVTKVDPVGTNATDTQVRNLPLDTVITIDGYFSFEDGGMGETARIQVSVSDATDTEKAKLSLLKVQILGPT